MKGETTRKDTPAPVTVAKGGRGSFGVYAQNSTQKLDYSRLNFAGQIHD